MLQSPSQPPLAQISRQLLLTKLRRLLLGPLAAADGPRGRMCRLLNHQETPLQVGPMETGTVCAAVMWLKVQ